ncbi:MAG: ABC transporter permease subunit [Acidobacteria bacterium]|nr:ABC transporter permease subunit [Acidobacteriota bacterium]
MKGQLQAGVLVLALAAPLAGAAQDSSARPDPSKFPARASYQGVTIAAVPIPDTPAAERIFGPRAAPTRAGFLPVEVIIFNQRSEIIQVKVGRIKIIGFDNQFEQVDPQAVAEGLYPRPEVDRPKTSRGPRLPVPWPRKQKVKKDKKRAQREEAEAALRSRDALGAERIALYQLHAPDRKVPLAASVEALAALRADGVIEAVGLLVAPFPRPHLFPEPLRLDHRVVQLGECVDHLHAAQVELEALGETVAKEKVEYLRQQYGLDKPFVVQYFTWLVGMLQGDFGHSFEYDLPVSEVVGDRLFLSFLLSFSTIVFTWAMAFPIGVYSATHQYSWADHGLTFLGFLGLATPNFLLALVLLYVANVVFGTSVGGLMDPVYVNQPMSWGKFLSVLEHLWIPVVVIGTSGTAGMIRRLRANLLDELQKQYVVTGRAKGLPPLRLLLKYPLRMALNPFIADIGNLLPQVVSGAAIVSIVLSLPTTGPMLLSALQSQDMYLAGSFLMFLSVLTVVGMFVSDVALAFLDPRIRLGGGVRR